MLTDRDRAMLDIEAQRWLNPGVKVAVIRERFLLSEAAYYQALETLIDNPDAEAAEPALVHRLRRLRERRQVARGAKVSGWA